VCQCHSPQSPAPDLEQHKTQIEPGKPDQYCTAMAGLVNTSPIVVSAYPTAWRIEVVDDDIHRGHEYVRSEHNVTRRTETLADAAY
jgi:hypothetical protein